MKVLVRTRWKADTLTAIYVDRFLPLRSELSPPSSRLAPPSLPSNERLSDDESDARSRDSLQPSDRRRFSPV